MPSEVNDHASPHRTVLPWKNSVVRAFLTPDCQRPGKRGGGTESTHGCKVVRVREGERKGGPRTRMGHSLRAESKHYKRDRSSMCVVANGLCDWEAPVVKKRNGQGLNSSVKLQSKQLPGGVSEQG